MQWQHQGVFTSFSPGLTPPQQGVFQSFPVHQQHPNALFQAGPTYAQAQPFANTTTSVDKRNVLPSRTPPGKALSPEQVQQQREDAEYKLLQSMQDTVARHHFVRNQAAEIPDSVDLLEGYVKAGDDKENVPHPSVNKDEELGFMGLNMFVDGYTNPPPNPEDQSRFDGLTSLSEAEKILKQLEVFNKELLGGKWPERQIKKEGSKWKTVGAATTFAAMPIVRSQSRGKTRPATSPSMVPQASPPNVIGGWVVQQASRSPPTRPQDSPPMGSFPSGSRQSTQSPPLQPQVPGRQSSFKAASVSPPQGNFTHVSPEGSFASVSPGFASFSPPSGQAFQMPSNLFQSVAPPARQGSQGALLGQPTRGPM